VWDGGDHAWRWGGGLPADCCERIGTLQFVVPDAPGELVVDLALSAPGYEAVANRYETRITAAG